MNRYISLFFGVFLFLLTLIAPVGLEAANQSLQVQKLMTLPADELLEQGSRFADKEDVEHAVMCYTIIVNRYDDSMKAADKMRIVESYERLWNVYFNIYSDYAKAYECLSRAQQICDGMKIQRSEMLIKYGAMYQVIYNLFDDESKYKLSYKYYVEAFRQARIEKNERIMTLSYTNLLLVAYDLHRLARLSDLAREYVSYPFRKRTEFVENNIVMYKGLYALERGNYDEAIRLFEGQTKVIPEDFRHVRLIYNNYLMLSRAEQSRGNYRKALAWIYKAGDVCRRFDIADMNAELYSSLYKCYRDAGVRDSALVYRGKFLECKEQTVNYQNMQSFARMGFQSEINNVTKQMSELKAAEKFHKKTLVIVSVFLVVFVFMSVFILLKNRRLTASFKSLYQKNVELMHVKEQMDKIASEAARRNDSAVSAGADEPVASNAVESKRSKLNQDEYDALLKRIYEVMRNPEYICNPDFSVEQLVSVVGAKYKTVLDVIHDDSGYNFSAMLNKCRIEEACRRINEDDQTRNYTVEAIAGMVGYRSRNSFTTAFKRITGLYPSEYIRIARERL